MLSRPTSVQLVQTLMLGTETAVSATIKFQRFIGNIEVQSFGVRFAFGTKAINYKRARQDSIENGGVSHVRKSSIRRVESGFSSTLPIFFSVKPFDAFRIKYLRTTTGKGVYI